MRRIFFLVVAACLATAPLSAQDPVKVDPKHYKVEFENDRVRVIRSHYGPHEKGAMHQHPANVSVLLTDIHNKVTLPDGKTEEFHGKAGQTGWLAAVKHQAENLTDKPFELIQVELKSGHQAPIPAVDASLDPVRVNPTQYKVEFENDRVRVLRVRYGPRAKGRLHQHPPVVVVNLTDTHLRLIRPDGETQDIHEKAGSTVWVPGDKHEAENLSDQPFEEILVELKTRPAAAKPAAKK